MKKVMNIIEAIKMFCDENTEKYSIYENYSGRFMFGRECIGIVVSNGHSYMDMTVKLISYLKNYGIEDVENIMENVSVDEFGLNKIVYFPKIAS